MNQRCDLVLLCVPQLCEPGNDALIAFGMPVSSFFFNPLSAPGLVGSVNSK